MNELQIFNYTDKPVRTITKDGEPWFAASDVCDILALCNALNCTPNDLLMSGGE